ncbi:molybdopterin-dependent oxidoreductase [Lichenicola cladoniae]|uniref:Molybdopterin-dependent oxidoreductase n=1 Tax=Lichenicola cladoniae TaxID=1484109 RepID=A0A6M8HTW8_9PROT|nr:molybdopterin-dependent oxidoreductase [Lichenicola cladoniae]NPD67709.1 molybdopterin-dependent oxidoreductase [Acetobacteraceae bacterium]QKE91641.1 molybdopterin-dependent oxidoreductase [Lichenicola cladoniae]
MNPFRRVRPTYDEVRPDLVKIERRLMLRSALSLGALSMLTGCNLEDGDSVDEALKIMSRFNDKVQAALFSNDHLAATFPPGAITKPFPFNAYYGMADIRTVDAASWRLELSGQIADRRPWSLAQLRELPQQRQITRHICIEGWSAIGDWSGVPFSVFLKRIGADLRARYVGFKCFDDYFTSIDMATALHPQTIMALDYGDSPLPPAYGAPLKLRMPTKLGIKNPKYIAAITITNHNPGGYWENQGYNWFSGS